PPARAMTRARGLADPVLVFVTVSPAPVVMVPAAAEATVTAVRLTAPVTATGPFTWTASPASVPVLIVRLVLPWALLADVTVTVSVLAAMPLVSMTRVGLYLYATDS